jgi:O-antigen/teichoic acid export membrane protein
MFLKLPSLFNKKNSFFKNVAILSGASVIAQVINMASMPVLSRLYSPSDFGTLALFSSIVGLLATISGFRYYLVIPLARTKRYLDALIWLSFLSQCFCVVLVVIAIKISSEYLNNDSFLSLMQYKMLIPIAVLCVGFYSLLTQWAIRERGFLLIAKTKLTQTIIGTAVKLFSGLVGLSPLGLILGNILGQSMGSTTLLKMLLKTNQKIYFSKTHIKRSLLHYRNLFFYDTPASLLNMSGAYLLPLIMAYYFNSSVVGSFSMAQNLLVLPSALIGTSIGQVFMQRATLASRDGSIGKVAMNAFSILMRIGAFPIMLLSLVAPELFMIILGPEWEQAGVFAKLLGPWLALSFVYSPLSCLYTVLMLQKIGFIFVSIYTLVRLAAAYMGRFDPYYAMIFVSIAGSVSVLIGIYLLMRASGINYNEVIRKISMLIFEVILEIAPLIIISCCVKTNYLSLAKIVAILWGIMIYFYILFKKYI